MACLRDSFGKHFAFEENVGISGLERRAVTIDFYQQKALFCQILFLGRVVLWLCSSIHRGDLTRLLFLRSVRSLAFLGGFNLPVCSATCQVWGGNSIVYMAICVVVTRSICIVTWYQRASVCAATSMVVTDSHCIATSTILRFTCTDWSQVFTLYSFPGGLMSSALPAYTPRHVSGPYTRGAPAARLRWNQTSFWRSF